MLNSFKRLLEPSKKYRRRFGQMRGFILWLHLRRHTAIARGTLHEVHIPKLHRPICLRAGTSDVLAFIQIFVDGELEFDLPKTPSTIVDAGANIGLASIYFANRFPKAKIVALEIDGDNFDLMVKNTQFYPNISCIKKALWSNQTRLKIINPTAESWAFRVHEADQVDTSTIEALSVSNLLQLFPSRQIDLLKIDIEGAEKEVFQNSSSGWIQNIGVIAVELHDNIIAGCSSALHTAVASRKHTSTQSGEYTVIFL